ncbi:MAG: lipoprotein [Desulfitobacteriia bacterium]
MKKAVLLIATAVLIVLLAACGQGNVPADNKAEVNQGEKAPKESPAADTNSGARIDFDRTSSDDATYKQHIETLWEQTKVLLREDITKDYSDEELKKLGTEIDTAWVNLQIHTSINHMEEIDKITDAKYANIIEDIMGLVDELYANRYTPSEERRQERLENLKNGRLEFKIKEFDETLQKAE